MKKIVGIAIILLFIGVAFAPSIDANTDISIVPSIKPLKKNTISIQVTEFKADGTVEKTIVEMSQEEVKNLKEKLKQVNKIEERLDIYKEYGLIPKDATAEKLRTGMEEKANRMGFTKKELNISSQFSNMPFSDRVSPLVVNLMCSVSGFIGGFHLFFGLSSLTLRLNALLWFIFGGLILLPSIDISDIGLGIGGVLETTNGLLPDDYGFYLLMFYLLGGFVGFCFSDLLGLMYVPKTAVPKICRL